MTEVKPAHHKVPVIQITEILPHTNADKLEIIKVKGYQCVTQKGNFKVGDYGVYIFPDSVVPQTEPFRFILGAYAQDSAVPYEVVIPERKRRITVRRFRKEWSEGLLLPVTDFGWALFDSDGFVSEKDDVSDELGIYHYDPPEPGETSTKGVRNQNAKFPRSLKGLWYWVLTKLGFSPNGNVGGLDEKQPPTCPPIYDVDAYKNFLGSFERDEEVVVTEKIHGSNGRFTYQKDHMYAGSRKLWKRADTQCIWRTILVHHPEVELWCRSHEGYALYVEVVPTQKEPFTYGCGPGRTKYFGFDILTPQGEWLNYSDPMLINAQMQLNWVPTLYFGPFREEDILHLADGNSLVPGADKQIKEGIVIKAAVDRRVRGLGRLQLKVPSNLYYEAISKG